MQWWVRMISMRIQCKSKLNANTTYGWLEFSCSGTFFKSICLFFGIVFVKYFLNKISLKLVFTRVLAINVSLKSISGLKTYRVRKMLWKMEKKIIWKFQILIEKIDIKNKMKSTNMAMTVPATTMSQHSTQATKQEQTMPVAQINKQLGYSLVYITETANGPTFVTNLSRVYENKFDGR